MNPIVFMCPRCGAFLLFDEYLGIKTNPPCPGCFKTNLSEFIIRECAYDDERRPRDHYGRQLAGP